MKPVSSRKKDMVQQALGWFSMLLAIAGFILPIMPGIPFFIISLALLAPYVPLFHRWQLILFKRFPHLRHFVLRQKRRARERFPNWH
jgi:uncharacterized membrane protein YbaN (DUF454 family)